MSLTIVSVSASNWVPLKAEYALDPYIQLYTTELTTTDGYRVYNQNIFNDPKDTAMNRETALYLSGPQNLLGFLYDIGKSNIYTGGYVTMIVEDSVEGTLYLSVNSDNNLYLDASATAALYIRTIVNSDNSLTFFTSDNKLITRSTNEPIMLTLEEPLTPSQKFRQQFNYTLFSGDDVAFSTKPATSKRYWGYKTTGPMAYILRANGFIPNDDSDPINKYLFNMPNFQDVIRYRNAGLSTEHTWVNYNGSLADKTGNKNVTLNEKVTVATQHLMDTPYHMADQVEETFEINIANLKSVMTEKHTHNKISE